MKAKNKRLSIKQKKFIKNYILTNGNGTQSALEAYNASYDSARTIAKENLQNPAIKEEITKQLDKAGLSLDVLHDYSLQAIKYNLNNGKPSQQAGISQLQFLYKLHNSLPNNVRKNMSVSVKGEMSNKQIVDLIANLKQLTEQNAKLIKELSHE